MANKQDTHFVNTFSLIIGLLVTLALCIFAFARHVGQVKQEPEVIADAAYVREVAARIKPAASEAVTGADNAALAIKPDATGEAAGGAAGATPAASTAGQPKTGAELFQQTCSTCHGQGIAGAPKAGDKAAWAARIAQGKAVLYDHAIKGFQGKSGIMPPKGGSTGSSDDLVKEAVDYMVKMSQ